MIGDFGRSTTTGATISYHFVRMNVLAKDVYHNAVTQMHPVVQHAACTQPLAAIKAHT